MALADSSSVRFAEEERRREHRSHGSSAFNQKWCPVLGKLSNSDSLAASGNKLIMDRNYDDRVGRLVIPRKMKSLDTPYWWVDREVLRSLIVYMPYHKPVMEVLTCYSNDVMWYGPTD
ncbi:hypothetical protein TanjilG_18796 [Lupinus angustifolius]|uniref:Uncharacterized protein n=1 Tax=Lupinus angustifolius TaxID=3871 RepID=A0A1J7H836_LUPAN|nr:hypothetical protein TanjilG_18796 [Lupinus angustifolius]